MEQAETFHSKLEGKMDDYAHLIYRITRAFPKEELYGATSQIRRSALSVILNYLEGYARQRDKVYKNFLEISYGSLKESKYLLKFSLAEGYIKTAEYSRANDLAEEIGAMLWTMLRKLP